MADKMQGMNALAKRIEKSELKPGDAERAAIREMVKSAKDRGLALTGPDGLLKILTKTVLEILFRYLLIFVVRRQPLAV
jgi:hypothetical protein